MLLEPLLKSMSRTPRAVAVRDPFRTLTFRDLVTASVAMRRVILQGTQRSNVGILLPAGSAFAASFFGGQWAGKTTVPLNFLMSADELADIVRDADLDFLIATRHFSKTADELPARVAYMEELPLKRLAILSRLARRPALPIAPPDGIAVLLYTSGTTGRSKGVELTQRNLRSNSDAVIQAVSLTRQDRFLGVLPPFHVFGLMGTVLVPAICGISVQMLPRFSPMAVLDAIEQSDPTVLMAIPSMYAALLRNRSVSPDRFRRFRLLISGGEPLPQVVADEFRSRFGVELLEGYGLTETSPVIALNTPEHHRAGSVGRALPDVQIQIVDGENRDVPAGDEGEIIVRGPGVMRGYRHRPEETQAVLSIDGRFSTGDIGRIDGDGYLSITGRKKDMIIVGGENVFPREIESVLDRHPDVAESAVIGETDTSRGEVAVAFILPKEGVRPDEGKLRGFVKEQLAGYKVPRRIYFVADFPRGPTGKVLKRKLKEILESGLCAESIQD